MSITRVTLFVPGTPIREPLWNGLPVEVEWIANDGQFGKAFSYGTVSAEIVAQIDRAPGAHVLHWSIDLREGRAQIVELIAKLPGALAVRLEQSKLGWDRDRWLALFGSDDPRNWHRGAIAFLGDKGKSQSCGMHAFSLPDALVDDVQLGSIFNVYQLAEDPELRSGETFAPDRETPKRVIERWPDTNYPPDHACHNPYGVWRFGKPGGKARKMGDLVPVFVPALHAVLTAVEEKQGKPLTKQQVEATRDHGACIMMTARDQQELDRSRGYGDLDPELAWEQWQALR